MKIIKKRLILSFFTINNAILVFKPKIGWKRISKSKRKVPYFFQSFLLLFFHLFFALFFCFFCTLKYTFLNLFFLRNGLIRSQFLVLAIRRGKDRSQIFVTTKFWAGKNWASWTLYIHDWTKFSLLCNFGMNFLYTILRKMLNFLNQEKLVV